MSKAILSYVDRDSPVHKLTGATKLVCFLVWSVSVMISFDTRVIVFAFLLGLIMLAVSKIQFSDVKGIVYFMFFFVTLNALAIFIFSPYEGVKIYGTRHDLFHIAENYTMTAEQLFYEFNITLKYFTVFPIALLFLLTTNPSEFASSLNKIGVNYKIAYSVSLALRYIPDVQNKYHTVAIAQQARGIDISRKAGFFKRVSNALLIMIPLIFSSLERIETISNAMELRRFGKNEKRTWYNQKQFRKTDLIAMGFVVVMLIASIVITFYDGNRFYNPF